MPTTRTRRTRTKTDARFREVVKLWNACQPPPDRMFTPEEADWLLGVYFFGERDNREIAREQQSYGGDWLDKARETERAHNPKTQS